MIKRSRTRTKLIERRVAAVVAVIAVQVLSAFLTAPSARAWGYMSWRWKDPAKITYFVETGGENAVPSWLRNFIVPAVGAWNQTPTPIVIHSTSRGAQQIYMFGYSQADGSGGFGTCRSQDANGYCQRGQGLIGLNYGCHYSNASEYQCGEQQATPNYNKYIVMHELGHVLGLAHSGVAGAVMNTGACRSETRCPAKPSSDDISGMNGRYGYQPYGPGNGCGSVAVAKNEIAAATGQQGSGSSDRITSGAVAVAGKTLLSELTLVDATLGKTQAIARAC